MFGMPGRLLARDSAAWVSAERRPAVSLPSGHSPELRDPQRSLARRTTIARSPATPVIFPRSCLLCLAVPPLGPAIKTMGLIAAVTTARESATGTPTNVTSRENEVTIARARGKVAIAFEQSSPAPDHWYSPRRHGLLFRSLACGGNNSSTG
jgi:hypothetical protein